MVWGQRDQIWKRNRLSFVQRDFCFFSISPPDFHPERPTPSTVASSRGSITITRFGLLLRYARREETFLRQFSQYVGAPVHPNLLLLFARVMGHPAGTQFPHANAAGKNASETCR